jgi:hypothetical protein
VGLIVCQPLGPLDFASKMPFFTSRWRKKSRLIRVGEH